MSDVNRLLDTAATGDRQAAADLLPLVYDVLRKLAAARMAAESPGHTLNATALVHEAYLRLVRDQQFDGCGHFFAAAAEAMRRILIENTRRKSRVRHGGGHRRVTLSDVAAAAVAPDDLLDLDAALDRLAARSPARADVVKLRFFAGLSTAETASALEISYRIRLIRNPLRCGVRVGFHLALFRLMVTDQPDLVSVATAERYWAFARAWLFAELGGTTSEEK